MNAPELSADEQAIVARFEAAEEPDEIRVERVAVAICEADADVDGIGWSWEDTGALARAGYRHMARAALDLS